MGACEEVQKAKRRRDYDGYDPERSRNSIWCQNYVKNSSPYLKSISSRFKLIPFSANINIAKTVITVYKLKNHANRVGVPWITMKRFVHKLILIDYVRRRMFMNGF